MPMYRRNLKHSRVKNLFKFSSLKNNTVLTVESALEFDTCFHLEYCKEIVCFEAQPEGFYYHFEGKKLPYTPDFRVSYEDGREAFLEIKPASKIDGDEFRRKFVGKMEVAKSLGCPLSLVTDNQIRVNPVLYNLKLLHRYTGIVGINAIQAQLLKVVRASGLVSINDLSQRIHVSSGELKANALALISRGQLQAELNKEKFGMHSVVWVAA